MIHESNHPPSGLSALRALVASVAALGLLAAAPGCFAHETQAFVVACSANNVAAHDFETTDASTLARVRVLAVAPTGPGESVRPVDVRFEGGIALASCERRDASVTFLLE
jgi:hypothetical protein